MTKQTKIVEVDGKRLRMPLVLHFENMGPHFYSVEKERAPKEGEYHPGPGDMAYLLVSDHPYLIVKPKRRAKKIIETTEHWEEI